MRRHSGSRGPVIVPRISRGSRSGSSRLVARRRALGPGRPPDDTARPHGPGVFIHRDFHPGNLLWSGSRADWRRRLGERCVGPAEVDAAHLRVNLAILWRSPTPTASWPATRPGTSRRPSASSIGGPGRRDRGVARPAAGARCRHRRPEPARGVRRSRRALAQRADGRPAVGYCRRVADSVDLLITGGTIVDGTGAPGRPGTVVVEGGGCASSAGAEPRPTPASTIDATGKVVAPGFIDLHSHGGLVILAEPRHEPKVRQGVTTEVVGVDGNGFAPFASRADLEAFVEIDAGLDGRPDDRLRLGLGRELPRPLRRRGQPQHRDADRQLAAADRRARLGRRPGRRRALDRMRGAPRARRWPTARSASAPGSTTRPASYATTEELAALTEEAGAARRLLPHPRPLSARRPLPRPDPRGDRHRPACRRAAHITHFYHRETHPGGPDRCSRSSTTRAPRAST